MKVLLAVPRHRFIWPCSEKWLMEASFALAGAGHKLIYIPGDQLCKLDVERSREFICEMATHQGADVLVMVDQDQYMSGPDTVKLAETCVKDDFTAIQAPYAIRSQDHSGVKAAPKPVWRFQPDGREFGKSEARIVKHHLEKGLPMRIHGFVGAGLLAINVPHLEYIKKPWWIKETMEESEDVAFSRRVTVAGRKLGVHMGLTSGEHWGAVCWRTDEMLRNLRVAVDRAETAPESAEAPNGVMETKKP